MILEEGFILAYRAGQFLQLITNGKLNLTMLCFSGFMPLQAWNMRRVTAFLCTLFGSIYIVKLFL